MKAIKNEVQEIEILEVETLKAILNGQKEKVEKLFKKTEKMFLKGSSYTRTLISTQFISPLTQLLEMNYSWGKDYLALLPQHMRKEHQRQIYSSGI